MQMKAQNAPGEPTQEREPAELSGGVGQGWLHSQASGVSVCKAAIRFLVMLVLPKLSFPTTVRRAQPQ